MSTLVRNKHTVRTGTGRTVQVEQDYALEQGLNIGLSLRRVFNALWLAKEQTPSGWISDAAILRIGWDWGTDDVTESLVKVAIHRLREYFKKSKEPWWVESAEGGMFRMVTIDPENPPVNKYARKNGGRPKPTGTGITPGPNHPWRKR